MPLERHLGVVIGEGWGCPISTTHAGQRWAPESTHCVSFEITSEYEGHPTALQSL